MKFRLGNVDVKTYSKKQTTMSPSGSFDLVKFFFQKGAQVTSNKIVVQLPYEIYWTTVTVKIIVVMTSSRSKNIIDYCKVYISQRVMLGFYSEDSARHESDESDKKRFLASEFAVNDWNSFILWILVGSFVTTTHLDQKHTQTN